MDIKKFGNNWYAFVTSRSTNSLYKLNYGSNLNNPSPVITDLGNFENLLSGPEPIKIIEEDGNWFGLIVNAGSSSIIRLSFGSNLDNNNPISETAFEGLDVGSNGMDLGISSNGIIAVIANTLTNKLTIINFGNSIQNNPLVSDVITTDAIVGAASIDDITLLFSNGNWFGFLVATGSYTVHRLDFGSNLFSTPSVVNISGPNFIANERPFGIQIKQDKGSFVGVIQTFTGPLYRLDFGPVITNVAPSVVKLGDLGKLSNSVNLELVKEGSSWYGFSIDVSNLTINRIDFSYPCSVNDLSSSFFQPTHISYDLSGMYYISLTAFDQNGYSDYYSTSINVSVLTAPDINFITENFCAGHNVNFNFVNNSNDLVTYSCSFGDTQTSTDPNPTHQYSSPGEYTVSLQVTAENGCHNYVEKNIKIYNPTSSSFTLPTGLICTNNEFTFTNNTVDNFDGNLTYQWYVDNSPEATTRDLKYVFLTNGNKDIKLKTSIPGCSSELVKTLNNVQTGPTVGFDYTGKCENGLTQFTNTSSGDIASYLWDLGNGQTRTTANVNEPYTSFGNYMVSLQTTGTNGCISSTSKPVTIHSTPQPDFSLDLPPFSCSGATSQFNDLTPGPTDSNLTQWSWSFGDAANGISIIKNPTYTYSLAGSYDVSLKATTNFGCAATKIKTIQIAQSPKPDFNTSAACLNQPTYFTDASGTNNKSWLWKVGNSSYTLQNPTHVFSSVGNFTAQLTVTGKNDCVAVTSKPITVPLPPVLDFTSQNNCAGQATIFKDVTSVSIDPAVLHTWDFAGKGSGSERQLNLRFLLQQHMVSR